MLEGTYTSPKIRRFAVILEIPWPHAIGLAGLLWRFAGKHAPTGEVGRHEDEEIATALEWPGDATELVAAMIRCKLLDPVPGVARFLVHDWPDHSPRYVRATLQRRGEDFSPLYELVRDRTTDETPVRTTVGTPVPATVGTSYSSSSTSSLSSSSTSTSTAQGARFDAAWAETIWATWVPGRKSGRKVGIAAIERSIRSLAKENKIELKDAAGLIAFQTRDDATAYIRKIEAGETELKFVPLASTYFKQERWNDGNEPEATSDEIRDTRIADEIKQARADMDGELDADPESLEGLVADS